ncbi:hypothetical protein MFIFM68171_01712 [Madurella fahalii]|uniref:RNA-dependent RNA polymerase n=1 Tax=Madurella fahalii TaxID=1157608 RepID=A0ABQ0G187_9PEZI
MEFFLGVPKHLDLEALEAELKPVMDELSISRYSCDKPRGKPKGFVRFVHEMDGQRFWDAYGEESIPEEEISPTGSQNQPCQRTMRPRLQILGSMISCRRSHRKGTVLNPVASEFEPTSRSRKQDKSGTVVMTPYELDCGHCVFVEGHFAFVAEWEHKGHTVAKFTKYSLTIEICSLQVLVHIGYADINELIWSATGMVTIVLTIPPTFLKYRPVETSSTAGMQRLAAINDAHGRVSSFCTVYQLQVPAAGPLRNDMAVLRAKGINVVEYDAEYYRAAQEAPQLAPYPDAIQNLMKELARHEHVGTLPFGILFLSQALAYNGYMHPSKVSLLVRKLAALFAAEREQGRRKQPISTDAFKTLFSCDHFLSPSDSGSRCEVDNIMAMLESQEQLIRSGEDIRAGLAWERRDQARVFCATITPTRILLGGPTMEVGNRILRKYPGRYDYFVRVHFCDENGQELFKNARVLLDEIYDRFGSLLRSGIDMGGRKYEFLGFSHSSLRSHSAWLAAPFSYRSRKYRSESIFKELGSFVDVERTAALVAARVGQAFSETPHVFPLGNIEPEIIDDVKPGKYCFSDGVAGISRMALEKVHQSIRRLRGYPTCLQIRWAGAKGVLSLDPNLKGERICIRRNSMRKFEGYDRANLEICGGPPKPIPMVLNRPLIKILEDRGAPHGWFLGLQRRQLAELQTVVADVGTTADFLKRRSIGEAVRLGELITYAYTKGIDYRHNDFLRSAMELILLRDLRAVKHKARIPIRKGITLIGVMDVTGELEEGQVYVTYDWEEGQRGIGPPPGEGPVIVTRSPAMHPGDFQMVENKRPRENSGLPTQRNCIVFSGKGARDLPSQLAGGDLDGDLYHIIWDPDIVVHAPIVPYGAAKYAKAELKQLPRPVELGDMSDWFVDFMRYDNLRQIATTHMILADQHGTMHPYCLDLAELHSDAVDFSKSGKPVDPSRLPNVPKLRPDFMDIFGHQHSGGPAGDTTDDAEELGLRPRYVYQKSENILGRLYREVNEEKIWRGSGSKAQWPRPSSEGNYAFWDQLCACLMARVQRIGSVAWWYQLEPAERLYQAYRKAVQEVAISRSEHPVRPLSEREIFVGVILNEAGAQTNRQRDRSMRLRDEYDEIARWIATEMRPECHITGYASELDNLELCLACLYLNRDAMFPDQVTGRPREIGIESFRIVAASALMSELDYLEGRRRSD